MTAEDNKALHRSLCKRWPGKFSSDDLGFWSSKLRDFALADVESALTKFKNTKRFVPKIDELLALLPRIAVPTKAPAGNAGGKDDGFAAFLRNTHPWLKPVENDAEVVLRYWRGLWFGYEAGARGRIAQMTDAKVSVSQEIREQAIRDAQTRMDNTRQSLWRRCVISMVGVSLEEQVRIDEPMAERFAEYIFAPPDAFRVCLADVRGDPFT